MISADVSSLARAAPNPTVSPRMDTRDGDSSFDQLLQAVTPDRSSDQSSSRMSDSTSTRSREISSTHQSNNDTDAVRKSDDRRDTQDNIRKDKETAAEAKQVDRKSSETKKSDDKPVDKKTTDDAKSVDEKTEAKSAEDTIQEAIAGAMAAQAAMAAKPETQPEIAEKNAAAETTTATIAAQQQAPVIQLPETDSQPLPDELKQAVQQAKSEVNNFQTAVSTATQDLENQAQQTTTPVAQTTGSTPASTVTGVQNLGAQEPAVKVVQITAQPEDMAEVDATKALTSVYASVTAKTENLVESKTLPMIQKISSEIVELAREQGKSMKIQIQPENMGKIDLRLVTNSDGMRIVMTTEIPATGKLLESHMDQLQRQLADAGVSISGMSVNSQNAQGQSANSSQNQSSGSSRPTIPVFQQESEVVPIITSRVSASGLDYRI
jgi:flagellar hook-length control protein FliK